MHPKPAPGASPPDEPPAALEARLQALLAAADPATPVSPAKGAEAAAEARALALRLGRPHGAVRAGYRQCTHWLRAGRYTELLPLARELLDAWPREGDGHALPAERHDLLRLLALAASECAAFDVALEAAQELVACARDGSDPGLALTAAFSLAACFERMGDSWQAMRVLEEAIERYGAQAPPLPLLIAHNALAVMGIGAHHLLRDVSAPADVQALLAQAQKHAECARALLEGLQSPAYRIGVCGNLGEILVHRGQLAEGLQLLHEALATATTHGVVAHGWRVRTSLADALLARGDAAGARAAALQLLADMGAAAPQQTAIRARHAAYRACRELGLFQEALEHFEAAERAGRERLNRQLRAQSELFVTRMEAERERWRAEQAQAEAAAHRERAAEALASAERDPLTGLGNRRHLDRRFAELLVAAAASGRPLALAVVDLDHFKTVNDRHGHAEGDAVLVGVAGLLRDSMRAADVVVRLGGEEFVVLLPELGPEHAHEVCDRLRERIGGRAFGQRAGCVTASIGLAVAAPGALPYDAGVLLARADEALYAAKDAGRDRVRLAA